MCTVFTFLLDNSSHKKFEIPHTTLIMISKNISPKLSFITHNFQLKDTLTMVMKVI